ncbi:hypothetical protein Tco_0066101 [Tanacetum coccineum]
MLNKDNYVPWSSRLLRYAKRKPNGKLIYNSIMHGAYVRRMILEPGDPDREVPINETFHEQTDEELTEKEVKQMEVNDQTIQIILMGLPEDIYAAVDSCQTTQEIWLHVQQMMKGSDIGIQDKKAKLFNEWEMFTSTDGESIESYYHYFSKLMNDFKRNKHFPENIASNLKFLNNLQPEWRRHVTIVHQTKDLHEVDYTQLYDFLKYNHVEVNELRVERLARAHDLLALMANSNNPYKYLVFHQDQPSPVTYMQQLQPNNNFNPQPSFNTNNMQQPMLNPKDITDPTTTMNMALFLMAKAFKLNYSTPTNNNQRISSNLRNRQIAQPVQNLGARNVRNQNGLIVVLGIANPNVNQHRNGNVVAARAEDNDNGNNGNQIRCYNCRGLGHLTVRPRRRDVAYLQTQLLIAQKEEARIQLQAEEFDLMAPTRDLNEIKEVNANCILMANLQQASKSGTHTDKAPAYDSDGSAKIHKYDNCYNNEIFNMFTQEEQYTELLDPISEPHQLSKEKSTVSYLQQEKKKLESDLKIREDELLDNKFSLAEIKIKEIDNILVKTGKEIQRISAKSSQENAYSEFPTRRSGLRVYELNNPWTRDLKNRDRKNYVTNNDKNEEPGYYELMAWIDSKHDNKGIDRMTKSALCHAWVYGWGNEESNNDIVSSDEEWEEHEYGNPPNIVANLFTKPNLDTHYKGDGCNHKKWNENRS